MDEKIGTCLAALDLSAAFDTLEHQTVLERLKLSYGISGASLEWIKSYLIGRTQIVRFDEVCSPPSKCLYGVPQGSVLGPILFSLFVSPISHVISSFGVSFHQFADDTQLYIHMDRKSKTDSFDLLDKCSKTVLDWFTHNGLSLNPAKTEILIMGTRQCVETIRPDSKVKVAGCEIEPSESIRSLGVTLDNTLSFDRHVGAVCKSASFHIRALRHIRPTLTTDMAKNIGSAIVGSRLDFCNSLLHGISTKNIKRLQRVQNMLARVVTGKGKYEHITPILRELHWLPIVQRIDFKIATIVFKTTKSSQPEYLADMLRGYKAARDLRSARMDLLTVPRTKTVLSSRRFSVAAPALWNSIPVSIRASATINSFKKNLKTYMFKSAFNT